MCGAIEWVLPAGPAPYWRGRVVDVHYDFAPESTSVPRQVLEPQ
jgi:hypothetical protein